MIEKQKAGFRFGKYRLEVTKEFGRLICNGRTYKLVEVVTNSGQVYNSLRLYNSKGRFIKQFLFEPEIAEQLSKLLKGVKNEKETSF
jgi:hypothetical protein